MKIEIKNNKKLTAFLLAGAITLSTVTITGCIPISNETSNTDNQEQETNTPEVIDYDIVDSSDIKEAFKTQVIDVPGEDFKLVIEYNLDSETAKEWRTTADKKIYTTVYTEGLPTGTRVYIDSVHTTAKLISTYSDMNGITQDTIDDEIHNSLMYGFPISNTTKYNALNIIEGQSISFISSPTYGSDTTKKSISEERYTEEEYLKHGVYANKISSIYGLLIQKGNEEPYGVDVPSDVIVLVTNTLTQESITGREKTYVYDRNGNRTEINGN